MHVKRIYVFTLVALGLLLGTTLPAQVARAASPERITISQAEFGKSYKSTLTLQFTKPISSSAEAQLTKSVDSALAQIRPDAGPTGGAFLVCNQAHIFTDSDGTFSFQHACGGTTGPWGYQLTTGLCAIIISPVNEAGMSWTRNGTTQGRQAPHPGEGCRYQFHGTFNPEHDFDSITYSDIFTFTVDVGGDVGSADLIINGSFYSARCSNPSVCP